MIYFFIALFLLSIVAKYFCDRIRFKGNFASDWMIGANDYVWYKRTWWTKNVFSFASDGWHFFDAVRVMSLCILVTLSLQLDIYWCVVLYIIHGLLFELLYRKF